MIFSYPCFYNNGGRDILYERLHIYKIYQNTNPKTLPKTDGHKSNHPP